MSVDFEENRLQMATNMHQSLLNALRQREADIIKFLAILGPALAGFVWLLIKTKPADYAFVAGTIGVQAILAVGAIYAVALGYNFRSILFQMKRIEYSTGLSKYIINDWNTYYTNQKDTRFVKQKVTGCPPEIIKVFWLAFLVILIVITGLACWHLRCHTYKWVTVCSFLVGLAICQCWAFCLCERKLGSMYNAEYDEPGEPPPT